MLRKRMREPHRRTVFAIIMMAMVAVLVTTLAAEARTSKRTHQPGWREGYSTIVVDAKTGKVLDSNKPDELRHPASLTKIMTLYLLFTEIEAGRLKLNSKIKISAEAAAQPPSKLGIAPGNTIDVESAIKAMITRSANDVAVAVGEVIAGDEDSFARLMTRKAHAIGMKKTTFKNASGLPNPAQVTTARDLALLGLAMQDRFPRLYRYFSTRTFLWRGAAIGNHNRLLGSVDGVDGIKTGYTQASGFNLVSNVKRGERHIVAVVLGGRTAATRDALMRELIAENIRHAHTGPRTAPRFAETPSARAGLPETTATIRPPSPLPGSPDPIRPTPVKILTVGKGGEPISAGDQPSSGSLGVLPVSALGSASMQPPLQIVPPAPAIAAAAIESKPKHSIPAPLSPAPAVTIAAAAPTEQRAPAVSVPETKAPSASAANEKSAPVAAARSGWLIQIGAFTQEAEARERLAKAKERAVSILAKVSSYTEKTVKGSTEYFRARFAGFDEASAKRACDALKREFACMAIKN